MNSAKVFELYNQIMKNYDLSLNLNKEDFKASINHCATTVAASHAVDLNRKNLTQTEIGDLYTATENAAFLAGKYVKGIADYETYINSFREMYSILLKVEMYRHFIAKGQKVDEPELVISAIESYINSEASKYNEVIGSDSIIEDLLKISANFKSNYLLIKNSEKSSTEKLNEIKNAALQFELEAKTTIQEYQIKYESNCSWSPLIKNLLLILTGVGILFTLGSLIYKGITGQYAFFDKAYLFSSIVNERDTLITKDRVNQLKDWGFFDGKDAKVNFEISNLNKETPVVTKTLEELWVDLRIKINNIKKLFLNQFYKKIMPISLVNLVNTQLELIEVNDIQKISKALATLENSVKNLGENDEYKSNVMNFVHYVNDACEPIVNYTAEKVDNISLTI